MGSDNLWGFDIVGTAGDIGQNFGQGYQRRRVGSALEELGPDASWNDRAQAIMRIDPQLGTKMLQYGDTLNLGRERNLISAAGRQQSNDFRQQALDDKRKKANRGALSFAKQATDLANYTDNVAKMPGLDAATGSYKPTGNPETDKLFQYIPAEAIPNKPGGAAANFEAAKKTLKAKIGFTELQAMRNASATGGALGQVAVQEIDFLQNSIAALDNAQDPATFRQSLAGISKHYRNLAKIMSDQNWGAESVDAGGDDEIDIGTERDSPQGRVRYLGGDQWELVE